MMRGHWPRDMPVTGHRVPSGWRIGPRATEAAPDRPAGQVPGPESGLELPSGWPHVSVASDSVTESESVRRINLITEPAAP
jgi:hypothetical protein